MGNSSGSKNSVGYKYQTSIHHAVKNYECISEANTFTNFYSQHIKVFRHMFVFDSASLVLSEYKPFQLSVTSLRT